MPELLVYSKKVAQVHGKQHSELYRVETLVEQVNQELSAHMVDEETLLFPRVKEIVNAERNKLVYSIEGRTALEIMIAETEKEHDQVGRAMEEIRQLSKNYALPNDACASYKLLFKMLEEFESDLFIHIHLENNIMFPKAIELEKLLF